MPQYLLAYHGGATPTTPEEGEQVMAAWMGWMQGLGSALSDGGRPIGEARTVSADGSVAHDAGANPVTGYSVLQAASLDDAVAKVAGCPVFAAGGSVEVCETLEI